MYYKQSTKDIQLVILSFDDVMFNLTKLRYNYYRRLCKLYNSTLDKEQFMQHLGSCRSMFSDSPIDSALLGTDALIAKIEEDLLSYAKMYGLKHRDGLVELMELFRQKKIKCVVTSTHPQKYTESLYKVAALYHRPTEIVYDDPSTDCLPHPALYQNILSQYQLEPSQVLLIAANRNSVLAANTLRMNVIYIPGLEGPSKEMEVRCLKVVSSLLEIINILLEAGRISGLADQYLLIRHDGGTQDLYQNYQHLLDVYRSDPQTLSIIEPIYQEEFSKAQKANVEAAIQKQNLPNPEPTPQEIQDRLSVLESLETALSEDSPSFNDINEALFSQTAEQKTTPDKEETAAEVQPADDKKPTDTDSVNPLLEIPEEDGSLTLDALETNTDTVPTKVLDENLLKMIDDLSSSETQPVKEDVTRTKVFTKDELKMFGIKEKDMLDESEGEDENDEDDDNQQPSIVTSFIVNIGYALIDALLAVFIGGIAMIGFHDWIAKPQSIFHFIQIILNGIGDISVKLFGSLATKITQFFNTSEMFSGLLAVIFFLTLVIWIGLDILSVIRKQKAK